MEGLRRRPPNTAGLEGPSELALKSSLWRLPRSALGPMHRKRFVRPYCFERREKKYAQIPHYSVKFSAVVIELALFHKCAPLPYLPWIIKEFFGKCKRPGGWYLRSPPLECCLDGLAKRRAAELELARQYPEVVEVLHARIGHAELHEGLELFSNDAFFWICPKPGRWKIQHPRILNLPRSGHDNIAETDVNLERYSGTLQPCQESDSQSFVFLFCFDLCYSNGFGIENQSIGFCILSNYIPEDFYDSRCAVASLGREVQVSRRTVRSMRPELEKQSTFQHKLVSILRLAQTIEKTLQTVLGQNQAEILAALLRSIE